MKDGRCSRCGSNMVYMKRKGISFARDSYFYVAIASERMSKSVKEVDHYLCTTCGYLEMYAEDKAKLEQVAKDWEKVG